MSVLPAKEPQVDELKQLKERLVHYTQHVAELVEQKEELKTQLQVLTLRPLADPEFYENNRKELQRQLNESNTAKKLAEERQKKLEDELQEYKRKNLELTEKLNRAEKEAIDFKNKLAIIEKDGNLGKKLSDELEKKSHEVEKKSEEVARIKKELDNSKKEIEKANSELARANQYRDQEKDQLLKAHRELVDKLQDDLARKNTEITNQKVEIQGLNKQIEASKIKDQEIAKRDKILGDKDLEIEKMGKMMAELNSKVRGLEKETAEKKEQTEVKVKTIGDIDKEISEFKAIIDYEELKFCIGVNPDGTPAPNSPVAPKSNPQVALTVDTTPRKRKSEDLGPTTPSKLPKAAPGSPIEECPPTPVKIEVKEGGDVQIERVDLKEKAILIKNNKTAKVDLSGWKLIISNDNTIIASFNFPQGAEINGQDTFPVPVSERSERRPTLVIKKEENLHKAEIQLRDKENITICDVRLTDERFGDQGSFFGICTLM